jgi:hypothetical protein
MIHCPGWDRLEPVTCTWLSGMRLVVHSNDIAIKLGLCVHVVVSLQYKGWVYDLRATGNARKACKDSGIEADPSTI